MTRNYYYMKLIFQEVEKTMVALENCGLKAEQGHTVTLNGRNRYYFVPPYLLASQDGGG
jgi:hypothetical protein